MGDRLLVGMPAQGLLPNQSGAFLIDLNLLLADQAGALLTSWISEDTRLGQFLRSSR